MSCTVCIFSDEFVVKWLTVVSHSLVKNCKIRTQHSFLPRSLRSAIPMIYVAPLKKNYAVRKMPKGKFSIITCFGNNQSHKWCVMRVLILCIFVCWSMWAADFVTQCVLNGLHSWNDHGVWNGIAIVFRHSAKLESVPLRACMWCAHANLYDHNDKFKNSCVNETPPNN